MSRLKQTFGGRAVGEIGAQEVEQLRAALGKKLSAASVNRHLALLKATFNRAMRADPPKADRNPVRGVKLLKENNERVRVLTDAEEDRLLAALPDYLHPFAVVALHTGMRRGELAHLEWEHVDFHTRTLRVTKSKSGEGRRVPMNRVVVETLRALRKARKVFRGMATSVSAKSGTSTAVATAGLSSSLDGDPRPFLTSSSHPRARGGR